jgi:(1->4)-alpha-D-glucan 1-alpha-D-glucosylmutase
MLMNPSETAPDPNEQILIYQSLLGAWPIELERMKQYMTKALREAKTHTSWTGINEEYEGRVFRYLESLYARKEFFADFAQLHKRVAYYGALSSLSQLVLKIASPGLPDFYQGTELWDLSLADPDNRRAVDFSSRTNLLQELQKSTDCNDLLKHWQDGRLKMYVTQKLLHFRRERADLFREGEYIPLHVSGARAEHVVAFARHLHDRWCIVAVPRLYASLTPAGSPPLGEEIWKDTQIEVPQGAPPSWTDVLGGSAPVSQTTASVLFRKLPLALLSATDYS